MRPSSFWDQRPSHNIAIIRIVPSYAPGSDTALAHGVLQMGAQGARNSRCLDRHIYLWKLLRF
jgi:hypothetical protein